MPTVFLQSQAQQHSRLITLKLARRNKNCREWKTYVSLSFASWQTLTEKRRSDTCRQYRERERDCRRDSGEKTDSHFGQTPTVHVSNKNRRAFCCFFFFVFRLAAALLIVPFSGLFRCGSEETLVRLCLLDSLIGEIHSGFLILVEDVAEYFLGGTSDSVGNIFSSSVLILSIHK